MPEIVVCGNEAFGARVAAEITDRLRGCLGERDVAFLALAGGTTPGPAYRALARRGDGLRLEEWRRVHFFWSDERWVPADDARSNVAAARKDLLEALDLPADNVHAPPFETDPASSAAAYECEIRRLLGAGRHDTPRFDLVLLGVGEDGHTASLFPPGGTEPEGSEELVSATRSPEAPRDRISFSYELLAAARSALIMATGKSKADVVRRALVERDRSLPVTRVELRSGSVCWMLDAAAAAGLTPV